VDPKDDPEARIRELERSLSDIAGKSELTAAAPTRTTAGFRGSKTVLLVVAISVVALAAGVAVVIARHSGGGSSTGLPSSRPSTSSATTGRANQTLQRLYQLLPQGYNANNCSPVSSPNRQALATVECEKTSDPRSPASAAFSLYPNATALADAFQNGIHEDAITPCPDGKQSPATWQTDAAPNVPAGSVLCGNYNNGPDLMWTQNKDLLLGDIQGPDLDALYQFWQAL
jgi:serine/threonine kinase PknH